MVEGGRQHAPGPSPLCTGGEHPGKGRVIGPAGLQLDVEPEPSRHGLDHLLEACQVLGAAIEPGHGGVFEVRPVEVADPQRAQAARVGVPAQVQLRAVAPEHRVVNYERHAVPGQLDVQFDPVRAEIGRRLER